MKEIARRKNRFVALFDLDGTLADYDSALARDLKLLLTPEDFENWRANQDEPRIKNHIRLIRAQPGWWLKLAKLEDGFQLLQLVRELGFSLNILTKGPFSNSNSWSEKVEWCRQHVSDAAVTITEDKSLVYGKILVDDWPPYVTDWLAFRPRGLVILPDRPWNQCLEHPQIIRYRDNLSEIRSALEFMQAVGKPPLGGFSTPI